MFLAAKGHLLVIGQADSTLAAQFQGHGKTQNSSWCGICHKFINK